MKTILILSTLILMALMTSCSDNSSLTGTIDNLSQNSDNNSISPVLVWKSAELTINTQNFTGGNETPLENFVSYYTPTNKNEVPTNYLIKFNGLTNSDTFGYAPFVKISTPNEVSKGGEIIEGKVYLRLGDENSINTETEFHLKSTDVKSIQFYISLIKVDRDNISLKSQEINYCFLTLSNLQIYTIAN